MKYNYHINLQLFSGEKTEDATPKKKRDAREKGQVFQSKEINTAIVLIAVFFGLKTFGHYMLNHLLGFTKIMYGNYLFDENVFTIEGMTLIFYKITITTAMVVLPIAAIALVGGVLLSYAQVGFLFTTKSIEPKLSKMNPIEGFKKLFSKKSLVELIKSFIKIFLVGYVIYSYITDQIVKILTLPNAEVGGIVAFLGESVISIAYRAGMVLFVMAFFDFLFQKWSHNKDLKMSKQEVKEEHKQSDGDPQVKAKIKEKQRQMAMSRMMSEVPEADVIITNPTHYAVAIRYDKEVSEAPYVLAKGQDLVAQKIKEIAKEEEITIVENKPLARTLYSDVEIGQVIPQDLYQSVAEILAYVYGLNK